MSESIPFSLLIKPASADCNLRCTYCFYLGKEQLYQNGQPHRMHDRLLEHIISSYLATDQQTHSFGWQGGEPTLMGLDFFRMVVDYQRKYRSGGSLITNGLQTNGTKLTAEWAQFLSRHRFLVGVSLDGAEVTHNRYRTSMSGIGSYNSVIQGIDHLKHSQAEFNILTLVSQANIDQPLQVYRFLRDELRCYYHQYIECVEFENSGHLTEFSITGAQWGNFLCSIFDEWSRHDTNRVSIRLFDSIITTLLGKTPTMCTFGRDCRNYLVVEFNGDVYPCDFYVDHDMKLGNILDDDWKTLLSAHRYNEFGRRKRILDQACRSCSFVELCAGDCQKNRLTRNSEPHSKSVLCDGWKQFFHHAMPTFKKLVKKLKRIKPESYLNPSSLGQTGRNNPCPCGSGKKYKRCCMVNH